MRTMKRILLFVALLLAPLVLMAQQWHTTIDIMHPAKYALPDTILDLIVVNNAVQQPLTLGHATKIEDEVFNDVEADLAKAATNILLGATQTLDESRLFANVGFVPELQNQSNDFLQITPLPRHRIQQLCHDFQSDAALVCNRVLLYDVLGTFLTEDYTHYAYLEAYLVSHWTLQFPDGHSQTFNYKDTLYWEGEASTRDGAIAALPARQDALLDMCLYAGARFATQFVPTWETVDRYFYENKDAGMIRGMEQLTHQRWEEAADIWTAVYQQYANAQKKDDKLTKAYAAANTAVAYEITDNLSLAHQWAEKAVQAFAQVGTADAIQQGVNLQYYAQQLTNRINENKQ